MIAITIISSMSVNPASHQRRDARRSRPRRFAVCNQFFKVLLPYLGLLRLVSMMLPRVWKNLAGYQSEYLVPFMAVPVDFE